MPVWSKWLYETMYRRAKPNWDTDTTPPEVVAWVETNHNRGRALDLGCGTGTHSLYLAQQGYSVTGVDFSEKAIELARGKVQRAGLKIDFRVADITRLNFLREPFDLVLDVLCFHGLGASEQARYTREVTRLTHPGSTLMLYALDRPHFFGVYGIAPEKVRQTFAPAFAPAEEKRAAGAHRDGITLYRFSRQS